MAARIMANYRELPAEQVVQCAQPKSDFINVLIKHHAFVHDSKWRKAGNYSNKWRNSHRHLAVGDKLV